MKKYYINPNKTGGAYPPPQSIKTPELVELPEEMLETFIEYSGFVELEITGDTVTGIAPNTADFEEWKAEQAEAEAVPISDPQADTDAMLIDHEYRLTLLELGLTE